MSDEDVGEQTEHTTVFPFTRSDAAEPDVLFKREPWLVINQELIGLPRSPVEGGKTEVTTSMGT